MTFLNDTLEYRQTVTSLKKSVVENQVSNIPSTSNATSNDNFDNFDDNGTLISDDNYTSISSVSPTASTSKKKKRINAEDYEEALLHSLTKPCEPNPIDGFVSRLAYTCETAFLTCLCYVFIYYYLPMTTCSLNIKILIQSTEKFFLNLFLTWDTCCLRKHFTKVRLIFPF
ncbi:uncharacterized protein LOC120358040 isoform X1 [Solenopsis invicta]|uniref:uncharacterized protein LOC120358040 isoform X1 n=1 Tax=Solenopsis invicta TaxID=13686 RepID=UPI00193DF6B9|nr:uncharacterized protein LOC120358040 isoform X1 [Solenopsis invicta]